MVLIGQQEPASHAKVKGQQQAVTMVTGLSLSLAHTHNAHTAGQGKSNIRRKERGEVGKGQERHGEVERRKRQQPQMSKMDRALGGGAEGQKLEGDECRPHQPRHGRAVSPNRRKPQ